MRDCGITYGLALLRTFEDSLALAHKKLIG